MGCFEQWCFIKGIHAEKWLYRAIIAEIVTTKQMIIFPFFYHIFA